MFEITSDAHNWFKWRHAQPFQWLSDTNNWVRAHVGDIIIVWRNTHHHREPNAIWFLAMLTDTDRNIQGILVKYRRNGNCYIPATENTQWGTKWCYVFSAQAYMWRRGAPGAGPSDFFLQCFQLNNQELHLQARFFKGLAVGETSWSSSRGHLNWTLKKVSIVLHAFILFSSVSASSPASLHARFSSMACLFMCRRSLVIVGWVRC